MAINIKVLTTAGVDIRKLLTHVSHVDDINPRGSSRFTGEDDNHNYTFDVRGSGFKYLQGIPTDGDVSRITIDKGSAPQLQIDLSPKLPVEKALKASSFESFIDSQDIIMTGNSGRDIFAAGKLNDTLSGGDGNDTLEGGRGNDKISGDAGNDILEGEKGNDTLFGGTGNDTLRGSDDKDVLTGGQGLDNLYGGAGADRFDFDLITDSARGSARDVIRDFSRSQGDIIDLRNIDANITNSGNQTFDFIGADSFSDVAGQLRQSGTTLQGDVNGDGTADFEIKVINAPTFKDSDFIL